LGIRRTFAEAEGRRTRQHTSQRSRESERMKVRGKSASPRIEQAADRPPQRREGQESQWTAGHRPPSRTAASEPHAKEEGAASVATAFLVEGSAGVSSDDGHHEAKSLPGWRTVILRVIAMRVPTLSPMALRAALIRLATAASEIIRPSQTASTSSPLVINRPSASTGA
jgi:hypothetical protein